MGVFILLVLLDMVMGFMRFDLLRQLTKPLIMLSLILFFWRNGKKLPTRIYGCTLLALSCSLMGDILLLYDHISTVYFILGLIAFLLALIGYSMVFLMQVKSIVNKEMMIVAALLLVYGTILFIFLQGSLGALKVPVIIYILGIMAMALTAYGRKNQVDPISFKIVMIGALCFILSDSILAINKFLITVPGSNMLVMVTYATAQYLIVRGLLLSKD